MWEVESVLGEEFMLVEVGREWIFVEVEEVLYG